MTKCLLAVLVLALLALPRCQAGDPPKNSFAELEGTWVIDKMEIEGKSLLENDEKWKIVIKDGKVASAPRADPRSKPLVLAKLLDASKKPKTVTVPYEGRVTFYGIYEVVGDELRVCGDGVDTAQEKNPQARRPKKFDSKEGLLLVFKREKEKR
jgi:uncharacterized protein (TIGR03067 family)